MTRPLWCWLAITSQRSQQEWCARIEKFFAWSWMVTYNEHHPENYTQSEAEWRACIEASRPRGRT